MNRSKIILIIFGLLFINHLFAQQDSTHKDSTKIQKLFARATYPLIKNSKWSGVLPVNAPDDKIDPTIQYKLLVESANWSKDSSERTEISADLAEAGRYLNLHIAAGVPKQNIHMLIVVHGPALYALLTNENYKKKYKTDNPNIDIINQLQQAGVSIIACGQAMQFFDVPKDAMVPGIKVAFSAKTALSTYQMKGYLVYKIPEDK